jgi:hypothetical protein
MRPVRAKRAIRNTLYRLGLHTTLKAVVQVLALQGIHVGEELVWQVRFEMLNETARERIARLSRPVSSPALRRRPQGFPRRARLGQNGSGRPKGLETKYMSTNNDALLFDHLGQHLVALCAVYVPLDSAGRPDGKERSVSFSAFVVVLDGNWFVITAGHVLGERFGDFISRRQIQLSHCSLADYFGKNAKTQMPTVVSFDDMPKFHVDDRQLGLDIGVFQLRDFYMSGLQSNGVVPLSEDNWIEGDSINAEDFAILGFPNEEKHADDGDPVVEWVRPCLAGVVPCALPSDAPSTTYPLFVGKLRAEEPASVEGMSGGPIFRLKQERNGLRYWLHGVQAFWRPSSRITFGCPMRVVAQVIRERLATSRLSVGGFSR